MVKGATYKTAVIVELLAKQLQLVYALRDVLGLEREAERRERGRRVR